MDDSLLQERFEWPDIARILAVALGLPLVSFQAVESLRFWAGQEVLHVIQVPVAFYHAWLLLGFFGVSSYVAGRQGARSSLFLAVGVAVAYYCATHFRGSVIWYGTFDFYQEPTNGWLRMLIAGTLSGSILAWAVNRIKGAADWRSSRLLAIGSLGGLWFFGFLNWRENAVGFTDSVFAPTRHISILVTSLFLSIVFILGEIHR